MLIPPIPAQDAEPLTAALRDLQERLFEASLSWDEEAACSVHPHRLPVHPHRSHQATELLEQVVVQS